MPSSENEFTLWKTWILNLKILQNVWVNEKNKLSDFFYLNIID